MRDFKIAQIDVEMGVEPGLIAGGVVILVQFMP